jgi:hypothetical protein
MMGKKTPKPAEGKKVICEFFKLTELSGKLAKKRSKREKGTYGRAPLKKSYYR